ncbi:MAG: Stp1/IreP family PP2C-type Ser/Thr phosphatase [Myxococcales bacterium]|nr:Stp1/IreP family PP2C-type Ser/Thr phosphatase [Myxococcales bacterium]
MDPLAPKIDADFYGLTDVGRVRKGNEDNFLIADLQLQRRGRHKVREQWRLGGRGLVFAVCDGMGGAAAGEVASQMTVDTLYRELLDLEPAQDPQLFAEKLDHSIQKANHNIFTLAQQDTSKKGMGTTVSAAAIYGDVAFLAQVGDSRAYLLRRGELIRVTKDQSLLERLIEEGAISPEHAENFAGKNVILQALGPTPQVLVDLKFIELEEGDVILLCSDGLHGEVPDAQIKEILNRHHDVQAAATALIRQALENGGKDNVTGIVLRLSGADLKKSPNPQPAVPQPVRYVRKPPDLITKRMEKELGLAHWINKRIFATPMLALYGAITFGLLAYFVFTNRAALRQMFADTKRNITIAPPAVGGQLVVASDIPDAELVVDDTTIGTLQNGGFSLSLPVGDYMVRLRKDGWASPVHRVKLVGQKPVLVEITRNASQADKIRAKAQDLAKEEEWLPGQDPK